MTAELKSPQRDPRTNSFHPLKFAMWLGIAAIIMLFAALTSAYIVSEGQGKLGHLSLPKIFWFNTAVILASSAAMQWTVSAFKKYNRNMYRTGLAATFLLGVTFLIGQYIGWWQMPSLKEGFSKVVASDYVFVISSVHAAHIAGGLLIMLVTLAKSFFQPFNPNKLVNVQIMATYWHFVDVLWIYLFIFFQINLA